MLCSKTSDPHHPPHILRRLSFSNFQSSHDRQPPDHHPVRPLTPPHSERMSAILAGANCNRPRITPGSEKAREVGGKGRRMAFNGTPSLTPVAWAVPPSPARDISLVFCAFADPEANRATTGRKRHNCIKKNCAFLCNPLHTPYSAETGTTGIQLKKLFPWC